MFEAQPDVNNVITKKKKKKINNGKIVYKYSPTILNEFGLDTATGPPACSAVLMSDLLCLPRIDS